MVPGIRCYSAALGAASEGDVAHWLAEPWMPLYGLGILDGPWPRCIKMAHSKSHAGSWGVILNQDASNHVIKIGSNLSLASKAWSQSLTFRAAPKNCVRVWISINDGLGV